MTRIQKKIIHVTYLILADTTVLGEKEEAKRQISKLLTDEDKN